MELQRGTLFFKLNAKMPLQFLYLGDLASAVCIQTFVILLYSAITHFIFGVNYSVNGTIIAALFICTLGMYGIGLIIAGLSFIISASVPSSCWYSCSFCLSLTLCPPHPLSGRSHR